jgi:Holliday junction resolvasome RuvABC endonuclease subunit
VTSILGIDPGRLTQTGMSLVIWPSREVFWSHSGKMTATEVVRVVDGLRNELGFDAVAIEVLAYQGPRTSNKYTIKTAQFAGEIIGKLEDRGIEVIQIEKAQANAAIGLKRGKEAGAKLVRATVERLFHGVHLANEHEIDSVAVAAAGAIVARTRGGRKTA